jgi:23S rRNA (cytosine1962-C5)-methyltransferase
MRRLLHSAVSARGEAAHARDRVVRLVAGATDRLPGWTLDRLGEFVFGTSNEAIGDAERIALEALIEPLNLRGLEVRRRARGGRAVERLSIGEALPEAQWLRDGPAEALIQLRPDSLSFGLFPDLASERCAVGAAAAGLRVLNLYSYSGLFGVHAALGGAASVTQVDSARYVLEMAAKNEARNGVSCRRICEDAVRFSQRTVRRGEGYDLVIHDPPTFGRARGKARSTANDLLPMLQSALGALLPGGTLVSVVNRRGAHAGVVERVHQQAAEALGRRLIKLRGLQLAEHTSAELLGGWYRLD